jgi:hypothetical protein
MNTGLAQATATAGGGAGGAGALVGAGGSGSAVATAQNSTGEVISKAFAPGGGSASALAKASVGSGSATLISLSAGHAASYAVGAFSGSDIGIGAMSAAYGKSSQVLQYTAHASFSFTTSGADFLDLDLLSDNFFGVGFDSLAFQANVNGTLHTYRFSNLASAESFFGNHILDLGALASGSQSISLAYVLSYNSGTSAAPGAGFGFTYNLAAEPSVSPAVLAAEIAPNSVAAPEPSTWVMMLIGLASLGWVGSRRTRGGKANAGRSTQPVFMQTDPA